jgi:ribose transport system substrate-binding protein
MASRRLLLFGSAATVLLPWIAACGDAPSGSPPSARPSRRRIALVMKTLASPFFVDMEKGARRAEADLGIQLIVKTAAQETSIEQQIAIVDELTREKVDAIVVAPGDSYRLIPVLKRAQDAGIVVVNVDNRLDAEFARQHGFKPVPFISVDNRQAAYEATRLLVKDVRRPTQAAIIEGIRTASNAEERKQGALKAFAENRLITVVASESANWKTDDAQDVARRMFSAHPRIELLVCANDMMALGAVRYLRQAKKRSVRVLGYDALEEARQAIRSGWLTATVDQQASQQGFLGVMYAARLLDGEQLPADTLLETRVITAATPEPAVK